jgi:hypothetical protein
VHAGGLATMLLHSSQAHQHLPLLIALRVQGADTAGKAFICCIASWVYGLQHLSAF